MFVCLFVCKRTDRGQIFSLYTDRPRPVNYTFIFFPEINFWFTTDTERTRALAICQSKKRKKKEKEKGNELTNKQKKLTLKTSAQ